MPGVFKIEPPVDLLSRREVRNHCLGKEMVFEIIKVVSVSKQEIREGKSRARNAGQTGEARLARCTEIESPAGHVGLRVVVATDLKL